MTKEIIQSLQGIIIEAGTAIMDIYQEVGDIEVDYKSDNSPLTKADQAANDVIVRGLNSLNTLYPIISEENKVLGYDLRKDYDHYWMVDPLDGTKEFIKRNGEFTVNIALCRGDQSIFGVVYLPVTKELYYGGRDFGAFKFDPDGEIRLSANEISLNDENLVFLASRSHINEETEAFMSDFKNPQILSVGSSLKFIRIAEGKADIYPRIAPTMEWDTAAAHAILEGAGGKVIQYGREELTLSYNKENLLNPYFVAYAQLI